MKKIINYIDPYTWAFITILSIGFFNAGYWIWDWNVLFSFILTAFLVFVPSRIIWAEIQNGGLLLYSDVNPNTVIIAPETGIKLVVNPQMPIRVDAVKCLYIMPPISKETIFKVVNGVHIYVNKDGKICHTFGVGFLVTWITNAGTLNREKVIATKDDVFLKLLNY